jgi:pimeloyl-ACP methyl ester carboxylesterase
LISLKSAPIMTQTTAFPALPEVRFARIPLESQAHYLGDRFSFLEAGPADAPCVLFLHGIGSNASYYRFQFAALRAHFRVVAWNAPGYWMSDNLKTEHPSDADYAQAVADFTQALGLQQFVLCGNSFGSVVAQAFAIRHPQRVTRLILTGTGVGQKQVTPERREKFEARARRICQGSYQYGDAGVDNLVGSQASAALRSMLVEVTRGTQAAGLLRAVSFRLSSFYTPDLASALTMPVLLVQGSEDQVNPRQENADLLLPQLPKARLVELPGIGHLPEVEAPSAFNRLLVDFAESSKF